MPVRAIARQRTRSEAREGSGAATTADGIATPAVTSAEERELDPIPALRLRAQKLASVREIGLGLNATGRRGEGVALGLNDLEHGRIARGEAIAPEGNTILSGIFLGGRRAGPYHLDVHPIGRLADEVLLELPRALGSQLRERCSRVTRPRLRERRVVKRPARGDLKVEERVATCETGGVRDALVRLRTQRW